MQLSYIKNLELINNNNLLIIILSFILPARVDLYSPHLTSLQRRDWFINRFFLLLDFPKANSSGGPCTTPTVFLFIQIIVSADYYDIRFYSQTTGLAVG